MKSNKEKEMRVLVQEFIEIAEERKEKLDKIAKLVIQRNTEEIDKSKTLYEIYQIAKFI